MHSHLSSCFSILFWIQSAACVLHVHWNSNAPCCAMCIRSCGFSSDQCIHLLYTIGTLRILISTISTSLLFMITLVIYLMVLARADQKALIYNDNWIYKEDDCHFNFTMGNYLFAKGCSITPVLFALYQDLRSLLHKGRFRMDKCSWLPGMSGMQGVKRIGQMWVPWSQLCTFIL